MKKLLALLVCTIVYTHAHVWVHNKSKYYIKFVAKSNMGEEVLKISPGYEDFDGNIKYSIAAYTRFTIDVINPNGSTKQVFQKNVSEGGNRKIVIKDKGSPATIYIAEDTLELRVPSSWGHTKPAEDTGTHWL